MEPVFARVNNRAIVNLSHVWLAQRGANDLRLVPVTGSTVTYTGTDADKVWKILESPAVDKSKAARSKRKAK